MIARLTGTLVDRGTGWCILDVNGVGYEVFSPNRTLEEWAQTGGTVTAHVSTQVAETSFSLYGFANRVDRDAFQTLLGVSGIGPKIALSTLDTFDVDSLAVAVAHDDVMALSKINGVGKKGAQRMALELKGKLQVDFTASTTSSRRAAKHAVEDALPLALAQLDFGKSEIDRALRGLAERGVAPDAPTEQRLSVALKILAGDR